MTFWDMIRNFIIFPGDRRLIFKVKLIENKKYQILHNLLDSDFYSSKIISWMVYFSRCKQGIFFKIAL